MSDTLKRYAVDERTGCAAIRDTRNKEYRYEGPGLYNNFSSVIEFVSYYNDYNGDATDAQKAESALKIKYLNDLCGILNGELPRPKTRTEYVKVEFEHVWEAVKAFEEGEEIGQMLSDGEFSKFTLLDDVITYIDELYRAIEKEIDWRGEVHAHIREKSGYHWSAPISEVVNDESDIFLGLARMALRATGELE